MSRETVHLNDNSIVSFRTNVTHERACEFSRSLNSELQLDHAIVGETKLWFHVPWVGKGVGNNAEFGGREVGRYSLRRY